MEKVRVAIIGGSGYSGEELLRLLSQHPYAELTAITSRDNAGRPVGELFPRYTECPLSFIQPELLERD